MLVGCCFVCSWDERSIDAYVMFFQMLKKYTCMMITNINIQT